jgi:hypothetical protein
MKNYKFIIFTLCSILGLDAIAGFTITLDYSTVTAYIRLFIEFALIIGIASVSYKSLKPAEPLNTESISDALRDLARERYHTRLTEIEPKELNEIVQAFNELAGSLADKHQTKRDLESAFIKLNKKPTINLLNTNHSYHPEIGPVKIVEKSEEYIETKNNDIITESDNKTMQDNSPNQVFVSIDDLYDKFINAQRSLEMLPVSFEIFKDTIETAKKDLVELYQCKDVDFEVVTENGATALRPKLIR